MANKNGLRTVETVEQDAAKFAEVLGDELTENIDFDSVDISMPGDYEIRVLANRRVELVRDANRTKLSMAANKVFNTAFYEQLEREYKSYLWQIAMIDRKHPEAKKISMVLMAAAAAMEERQQQA